MSNKITNTIQNVKPSKIIVKKTVKRLIILIAVLWFTNPSLIPFLPKNIKATLTNASNKLWGDVTQISKVVTINWIVLFQLIVMVLAVRVAANILKALLGMSKSKKRRVKTFITLLDSMFQYLSAVICMLWGLIIIGVNISTVFATVGIAAAIVTFCADSLISDIITGVFLLFENQYNIGDIIEVENFRGTIKNIGIRTTSIEDNGNNIKVINNSDMRNIINRSHITSKAVCDIAIPLNQDMKTAESTLNRILKDIRGKSPEIFKDDPRYIGIQALSDKSMTLRVIATVEERHIFDIQRFLNREIVAGFQNAKILPIIKVQDN